MPVVGNGSLFKVIDFQSRGVDTFLNRYWYFIDLVPGTVPIVGVLNSFEAVLAAWLPPIQPTVVNHTVVSGDEVTSASNFLERASIIGPGTLAGDELASYQAVGIRLLRTTRDTRSGWKRIAAGVETSIGGNNWGPAFLASVQSYAVTLYDSLNVGSYYLDPVIVRQTYAAGTGELNPPSQWIYNVISGAEVKPQVTTQNSRKVGRGA